MTDLDALKWEQRVRPNGDVIAILAVADFRALVEQLRKAEALNDKLSREWQGTVRAYDATENWLQARIAQLERVRKAAQALLDTLGQHGEPELRAALDAVRLTETPTAPKAG